MDGPKHSQGVCVYVKKDSTTNITSLASGPWGIFRRLRILCGGQIVEDIDSDPPFWGG